MMFSINSRGKRGLDGKMPQNGKFAYAGHYICPRLTKIYTNMDVPMSNICAQNVPQMGSRPPKGGQDLPQKGKFVHHGNHIYLTANEIYPNMSVHSTTYAAQYDPNSGRFPPFGGINPLKRGNLGITATVFIAQQPKFTQTCRSIVPLAPHNMSPPNSGRFPPLGGINPKNGETIGHLRRTLFLWRSCHLFKPSTCLHTEHTINRRLATVTLQAQSVATQCYAIAAGHRVFSTLSHGPVAGA